MLHKVCLKVEFWKIWLSPLFIFLPIIPGSFQAENIIFKNLINSNIWNSGRTTFHLACNLEAVFKLTTTKMQWFLYVVNNRCLQLDYFEIFKISYSHAFVPKPFKCHLMRAIYVDGIDIWLGREQFTYLAFELEFTIWFSQSRSEIWEDSIAESKLSTEVLVTAEFGTGKKYLDSFVSSFPQKPWVIIGPMSVGSPCDDSTGFLFL